MWGGFAGVGGWERPAAVPRRERCSVRTAVCWEVREVEAGIAEAARKR